ncbi:MAG: restriction endonuclease subunit S, partial [Planctomycetes bacterium]|nr:restriction endonuclease subunit S [Planctomycetota bacterium]
MNEVTFLQNFKYVANAPNGVQRIRELVLQLATTGRLVPRLASDEDSESLVEAISNERERLADEAGVRLTSQLPECDSASQSVSVPGHWRWIRLGNLTSKIGSGSTPRGGSKVYVRDGIPFLRSQNIWNDGVRLDDVVFISAETHAKMRNTHVFPNDILLNITGASLGRCAIAPFDFPAANVSQHVTIIRPLLTETRLFLHICLLSPFGQGMIWGRQVGMAREGLSKRVLEQFEIPLPPLKEQKRIVAKVDELMRLCDRLEAQQQEREKLLPLLSLANHDRFIASPKPANFKAMFRESGTLLPSALRQTLLEVALQGQLLPPSIGDSRPVELLQEIEQIQLASFSARELNEVKTLPTPTETTGGYCTVSLGRIARIISGQHLLPAEYTSKADGIPYITGPAEF